MNKETFDGYAQKYDKWFLEHENIFKSELALMKEALGNLEGKKVLSVGCGSGYFESFLKKDNDFIIEGVEPSEDMASIAIKRGIDVTIETIEKVSLKDAYYDIIYFNTSSCYISDIKKAYQKSYHALKKGGRLVIFDIPKESAYGIMYMLLITDGVFNRSSLEGAIPNLEKHKRMVELLKAANWRTTEEKIDILRELQMKNFTFLQTLIKHPFYSNEAVEQTVEGYKSGSYVAIISEK